jgi:hypothetical protein
MAFHPSALEHIPEQTIILVSDKMLVSNNQTRLSFWKCSHLDCIAYPGSKRAMFCRAVQRPLWALIFIMCVLLSVSGSVDCWLLHHALRT